MRFAFVSLFLTSTLIITGCSHTSSSDIKKTVSSDIPSSQVIRTLISSPKDVDYLSIGNVIHFIVPKDKEPRILHADNQKDTQVIDKIINWLRNAKSADYKSEYLTTPVGPVLNIGLKNGKAQALYISHAFPTQEPFITVTIVPLVPPHDSKDILSPPKYKTITLSSPELDLYLGAAWWVDFDYLSNT